MGPIRSSVPSLFSRDTQKHERNLSDGALRDNDSATLVTENCYLLDSKMFTKHKPKERERE